MMTTTIDNDQRRYFGMAMMPPFRLLAKPYWFPPSSLSSSLLLLLLLLSLTGSGEAFAPSTSTTHRQPVRPQQKDRPKAFNDVCWLAMTPSNSDNDNDNNSSNDNDARRDAPLLPPPPQLPDIEDPLLLVVDVLAILLSGQLMGFLDVTNDPSFWQQGGFFQPIPAVPSTLGTYVDRVSVMSICWVMAGWLCNSYRKGAYDSDKALWVSIPTVYATFVLLRLGLTFVVSPFGSVPNDLVSDSDMALMASSASQGTIASSLPFDVVEIGKQCYYPLLVSVGFRYLYGRMNR